MKWHKVGIKLLMVVLIQVKVITMEPAWHEISDGKRYLIDTEEKYNWNQAWNECARYNAKLVAIENEEQNHIITKLLKNLRDNPNNLWIGGNVLYDKLYFYWATKEREFTFTNWATDDVGKKQCVYLTAIRLPYGRVFPWNIAACDTKECGYICEEINIESVRGGGRHKSEMYKGSIYGLIG